MATYQFNGLNFQIQDVVQLEHTWQAGSQGPFTKLVARVTLKNGTQQVAPCNEEQFARLTKLWQDYKNNTILTG